MQVAGLLLIALAGLISIAFGVRYILTRRFMPYHETVSGRSWDSLEPRLQAIILGMLKVAGGGLLGFGAALLWLLVPLAQGASWGPSAVVTISMASLAPVLYTVVWLRRIETTAKTPVVPTIVVLSLTFVGAGLVWAS
jgi:hypothetical protein